MSKWVAAKVVGQKRWTDDLYSLQVDAELAPFEAGQFGKIALDIGGEEVARPYSFVNAPQERPYEFYYIVVPEGPLSPHLARLQAGDTVKLAVNPAGFLALSEVPDAAHLWLIATGTGIGPFLSILKTPEPWQRFAQVRLVHAVRHANELVYRDRIDELLAAHPEQLRVISFVSREAHPGSLGGRVPAAIESGALEGVAGLPLSATTSQVMLCGNPDMVRDTMAALQARGMKRHRRRDPGHITMENYW
jgi:ferredoxin/flavodoxin---NADP+ reductase